MKAVLVQRQISAAPSIVSPVLNIFITFTKEMSFLVVVSWAEINIFPTTASLFPQASGRMVALGIPASVLAQGTS